MMMVRVDGEHTRNPIGAFRKFSRVPKIIYDRARAIVGVAGESLTDVRFPGCDSAVDFREPPVLVYPHAVQ